MLPTDRVPDTHDGGKARTELAPGLLRQIQDALQNLRYGTLHLVIHDGRVVQLERCEKVRMESKVSADPEASFPGADRSRQ